MKETASQKLNDLIGRFLVMADKIVFSGEVKTCFLHNQRGTSQSGATKMPVDNFPPSPSYSTNFQERSLSYFILDYLTLYIESLKILLEPLVQLWNLQSLVVETRAGSIIMKPNIWMMIRLRYLKTKADIVLDNKWKGKAGEKHHTLERLAPESCTKVVSKKAKNLKKLGIYGNLANVYRNEFQSARGI
ncbi:hypothetical protein SASPL_134106 [Salvia splendens]|uniref:Uncharacterized protein n=1 Tax=Salvia splendens TaxID=180675 RepID=A0A8X8ZIL9_SALSN|nr:hypothetical protein SASPL_134106 [Salvia splendens]